MSEGSILVVCPKILRYSWVEELERWLPFCLPADIHLVFGHENNPANLKRWAKIVVISYTMLHHFQKSILDREWTLLIVDESHNVRCTKKKSESKEVIVGHLTSITILICYGLVYWDRTSFNLPKHTVMPNMFGVFKGKFFGCRNS